jgi:hypothetical protein
MEAYAQSIHIMLMANTLQFKSASAIQRIFDIKGSKVKRDVPMTTTTKNTAVLKDINLLRLIDNEPKLLNFMKGDLKMLNSVIKRDVNFMLGLGIMDFSLLLAVEKAGKFGD